MAQQLSWHASYDPLTGLANRREFERYLRRRSPQPNEDRRNTPSLFWILTDLR
ncbi:MAG: hypothetical protein HC916_10700 [Coleofasciculaceae cyanobacterium SM2_1_6]|nr:hypothetical protein [Coleofasciculaceae cyanobacterium SM2_1_6]